MRTFSWYAGDTAGRGAAREPNKGTVLVLIGCKQVLCCWRTTMPGNVCAEPWIVCVAPAEMVSTAREPKEPP